MHAKLYKLLAAASALSVCFSTAGVAHAQSAQGPEKAEQPNDDIVVTGERNNQFGTDVVQAGSFRGAKTLDTPLTIAVIPQAVLQSQQALDLIDAVRNTPGVSTSGVGPTAYSNVTIRGINVDTRANYKLDGALNILSSVSFPLEDKDRVEVLKGASALYYGFSTPSGIVNLTMKRATESLYLRENTFFDSNGSIGEHIDIGDTVGPLGFRLNAVAQHAETGIDFASGKRYLLAGAFDLKPVSGLTITADFEDFARDISEAGSFRYITVPTPTIANPYPKVPLPSLDKLDPARNFATPGSTNHAHETNYLGKIVYKFTKDWNISVAYGGSYQHRVRYTPQVDLGILNIATGATRLYVAPQDSRFKNVNYSAELAGRFSFGSIRNEILVGAARRIADTFTPFQASVKSRPSVLQNIYDPVNNPFSAYSPAIVFSTSASTTRIDDKGYYVFDRLSFNDVVELLGGIRRSDYSEILLISNSAAVPGVTFHATPTSYSGGVVVKPTKWSSIYGTYIQGLESTPGAPGGVNNPGTVLPPANSIQKEFGVKLEPMKNLLFQAAYFNISRASAYVNAANFYVEDGRARYRGIEVSLTGNLTPDLAVIAGYTYLDAKQVTGAPTVVTGTSISPTQVGLTLEGTPAHSWSLAGEYTLSWLTPGLKVSAGTYYTGKQATSPQNYAFTPAYETFDLGASYTFNIQGHELIARVNGQNITGKRYWASVGGSNLSESLPSVVKFSLGFKY